MTPKSKDDINNDLKKLSPEEKLTKGYDYSMSWLVKLGLEEGAELKDDMGELLLQDACLLGRLDIVQLLLDKGVSANTPDALSNACVVGHESIVSLLLDKGADPNYNFGESLKKAAEGGNLDCVKLLLVHGAEMRWAPSYIQKLRPNVSEYLLNYKKSGFLGKFKDYVKHKFTNESVRDKMTPKSDDDIEKTIKHYPPHEILSLGYKNNIWYLVKRGIEQGANVHTDHDAALRFACQSGELEIVKYLIDKGANVQEFENDALVMACYSGNLEVVKCLVDNGGNIHDGGIEKVLRAACSSGHPDIVEYLLNKGAKSRYITSSDVTHGVNRKKILDLLNKHDK